MIVLATNKSFIRLKVNKTCLDRFQDCGRGKSKKYVNCNGKSSIILVIFKNYIMNSIRTLLELF
jgi:hypothetical protein